MELICLLILINNSIDLEDQVIKLNKHDFGSEVGGGIDLFLEYFKLGIELKLGSGMRNMLYDTPGEDPINLTML